MFRNYLKIAFRNLVKNKTHSIINIGGLTLGIVCTLVIFLIIQFDLSFDTWHEDGDRVYRIVRVDTEFGDTDYNPGGSYPMARTVREEVTGIEYSTIVNNNYGNDPVITYSEEGVIKNKFKENRLVFVDEDYFNILTYQWLAGDRETAINRPNTAVITKKFAEKMFGNTDVIGKELVVNMGSQVDIEITGLVNDQPKNSDFPFTIFLASNTKDRNGEANENDSWSSSSSSYQTYVKISEGVTEQSINDQLEELIVKYRNEETAKFLDFYLQPLSEIHSDSNFDNYNYRTADLTTLSALGIIGLLLLITACINFINLNTAIAVSRSKEVGLRKTLGGTKTQLTIHFLGETAFVTIIALLLGVGITEIVLLKIEPILGFSPNFNLLTNIPAFTFLAVLFVVVTLSAGWYPAQYLSSFNPIEAIRNNISASYGKGITLRRSLIVVQFTITQILIIGTIVIATQINYFQNQDLGFEKEALIEVPLPVLEKQVLETFKTNLLNQSSINNVTYSNTGTQSGNVWAGNYTLTIDTVRYENNAQVKFVDEDFIETYGLTLLAGSNLHPSDTVNAYIVNEAFVKQIGLKNDYAAIIGESNLFWGSEAPIIGVVKNFNTQSLHTDVSPVLLTTRINYYMTGIKINTAQTSNAIASIEEAFNKSFPDYVFEYAFLDENISEMYEDEQRTARIMNAFSIIAIIIGSLGLFGLVSYMATTRIKEIGVRKVLGATILDILKIFGTEISLLLGISFVIASPLSWFLMQQWLTDFAYQIDIGLEIFLIAFAGTLFIAVLTVGYKSISLALRNPIESLKSE